jgi:EAL domain-containing protein (putative c-di-GMP-specific phosphodiesterase class I)
MSYEDILFENKDGVARITFNRPSVMNAFRGRTCEELIDAFNRAGWDKSVGVIVLAGSGDKAVNLPFDFFRDPDWVMNLCGRMPNHPAFDGLIVEINAADLIADLDLARAVARRVRFSNIAVSVDDLGSECISLVGLDNFPFVEIKVDRQFVAGCADDRLKRTACRQILDIADGFGCRTVAQGIETRADFFAAREMDFDMVQGFLFAKPMTAQKFALTSLRKPVTIPD